MNNLIKEYKNKQEYERESKELMRQGYEIVNEIIFDRGCPEETLQVEYEKRA